MTPTSIQNTIHQSRKQVQQLLKFIVDKKKPDSKIVSILLFGSHARGTAHKNSDIDIELIVERGSYRSFKQKLQGALFDFEQWPRRQLLQRLQKHPETMYPYLEEKILFDRSGFARQLQKDVRQYFRKNKAAFKEWKLWTTHYLKEKKNHVRKTNAQKEKECRLFYRTLRQKYGRKKVS